MVNNLLTENGKERSKEGGRKEGKECWTDPDRKSGKKGGRKEMKEGCSDVQTERVR
jgi:hypothetical protein